MIGRGRSGDEGQGCTFQFTKIREGLKKKKEKQVHLKETDIYSDTSQVKFPHQGKNVLVNIAAAIRDPSSFHRMLFFFVEM